MDGRFHDVLQHGHVREKIEPLENHACVQPGARGLALLHFVEPPVALGVAHQVLVDVQASGVDLFQVVDAPEEGRLPGAGRSDQARH